MLSVTFNFHMFWPLSRSLFFLLLKEGVEKALIVKGMNGKTNTYFGITLWKCSVTLI